MLLGEKLHREERRLVQLTDAFLCLYLSHVRVSRGGHTPQTSSAEYVIVG